MKVALLVPVKQLANAKQRLGGLLTTTQRSDLFRAMVADVLKVASSCDRVDQVFVMTSDLSMITLATAYAAKFIAEPEETGLTPAVTYAADFLANQGFTVMVFLPGDVPLISIEELEVVLDGVGYSREPEFLIVPASDLAGSNCVVCAPPNCMIFGFGKDSFRRHLQLAQGRGIEPRVVKLPGIGLDVDTPADLQMLVQALRRQPLPTHTSRFLFKHGMMQAILVDEVNIGHEVGI